MNDFIGIYENAVSNDMCDFLVNHINEKLDNSSNVNIAAPKDTGREDEQFFLGQSSIDDNSIFNDVLGGVCEMYRNEYPVLQNIQLRSIDNKLQRTKIGGGYHNWHFEQTSESTARRVIVWTVYLNDVEEGGETEFLYLHKRLKPKKGTVVFFQLLTHIHTEETHP